MNQIEVFREVVAKRGKPGNLEKSIKTGRLAVAPEKLTGLQIFFGTLSKFQIFICFEQISHNLLVSSLSANLTYFPSVFIVNFEQISLIVLLSLLLTLNKFTHCSSVLIVDFQQISLPVAVSLFNFEQIPPIASRFLFLI